MLLDTQTRHRAEKSLQRLRPRFEPLLAELPAAQQALFWQRLERWFPEAFALLLELYGGYYSFFYHLEMMLCSLAQTYAERPAPLQQLDAKREAQPRWFQSEKLVGAVLYVDLFAETLAGVQAKIPYLLELGISYLHLMPLYRSPAISDGGYAVSSYREVNPSLGTMADLRRLAAALQAAGINLVMDFVFNHTSDEHEWAQRALAGDTHYQQFYYIFPDRQEPDQYEPQLREIFPQQAPGSFTYRPEIDSWVWTTFNPFQWDLRYANPAVFHAMLGELLFLANVGVDVLRLDAVPFIWKQKGNPSENLPQAHTLIQAFYALLRIAAPAMAFKSEAIVHPDDVVKYFGVGEMAGKEASLSYNPTLMALLWEALATRDVSLLRHSMQKRFAIPENCAWVNYVRVHDDIGWSFADEDAWELGINPFDHRQFLNRFYTGRFPGSFARGLLFNYNPINQDGRINGTCASLAGLEKALEAQDPQEIDLAIGRILLLHSVILSVGGVPLLYMGDELGTLNDYSYQQDAQKFDDSRWVHRPRRDWAQAARREDSSSVEGRIYQALRQRIHLRRHCPLFGGIRCDFLDSGNPQVLAYVHWQGREGLLVLANFSEQAQALRLARFRTMGIAAQTWDLLGDAEVSLARDALLEPYQVLWLAPPGYRALAQGQAAASAT